MFIKVKVFPEEKENKILKKNKDSFSIWVKEKAGQGRANRKVVEILAEFFNVGRSEIRLVRGAKTRNKIFDIIKEPKLK